MHIQFSNTRTPDSNGRFWLAEDSVMRRYITPGLERAIGRADSTRLHVLVVVSVHPTTSGLMECQLRVTSSSPGSIVKSKVIATARA